MMRINLLPIKAAKRHDVARNELFTLGAIAAVVIVSLYIWNSSATSEIDELQVRLNKIKSEITQIKSDVTRVKDFKKSVELLERKKKAIGSLYKKRFGPAKMLDDLATILTREDKIWLTELTESDGDLKLVGGAMDHESISDFQIALERNSKFFKGIRLTGVETTKSGKVPFYTWTILCNTDYAS